MAREGERGPGPDEEGISGGVTGKDGESVRLRRAEGFRPRDTLLERPEESAAEVGREGRAGRQGEATRRGRHPIDRRQRDGEPEPRPVDVADAATQARPVVVIVVGRTVMADMVVMAVVGDGMRVGVSGLRPEARESDDGRDEESQELCRMESSHSPIDRPGELHS